MSKPFTSFSIIVIACFLLVSIMGITAVAAQSDRDGDGLSYLDEKTIYHTIRKYSIQMAMVTAMVKGLAL